MLQLSRATARSPRPRATHVPHTYIYTGASRTHLEAHAIPGVCVFVRKKKKHNKNKKNKDKKSTQARKKERMEKRNTREKDKRKKTKIQGLPLKCFVVEQWWWW